MAIESIDDLNSKIDALKKELLVAQQKRGGHYAKLEYQIKENNNLKRQLEELQKIVDSDNKNYIKQYIKELDIINNANNLEDLILLLGQYVKLREKEKILEDKVRELSDNFNKQRKELIIAQQKRSGHYAKLEYQINKNKELEKEIEQLKVLQNDYKNKLTWMLGEALLECKSLIGILKLPWNIISANRKFRTYKQEITLKKELINHNNKGLDRNFTIKPSNISKVDDIDYISILGWPKPSEIFDITVMAIADSFTMSNLKSVANLITPRPDNWKGLLYRDKPDLLFVESAWNGNNNSWQYRIGTYVNFPSNELAELVEECKKIGIPTVFWNKEDPVHFDKFKNAAKMFDYIFTSDEGCVKKYNEIATNAKVFVLPFSADSNINNPIGSNSRKSRVCFAGSFYNNIFSSRKSEQLMLLDSALEFGLDIYDRNANNPSDDFRFPDRFAKNILGSLPYNKMNDTYKQYKVFLNVNSVSDSKTMFSRRIFELLASGTPIVSTYSLGIEEFFGKDIVYMVDNKEDAKKAICELLNDEHEWRRRSIKGMRKIFLKHTFKDRFNYILDSIGVKRSISIQNINILCVMEVYTEYDINNIQSIIQRQETFGKLNLHIFLILRNKKIKTNLPCLYSKNTNIDNLIREILVSDKSFAKMQFVSIFSPNNIYGKYYLIDLYLSTLYADADIIAKPSIDTYSYKENKYKYNRTAALFKEAYFTRHLSNKQNIKIFLSDAANFALKTKEPVEQTLIKIEF